MKQVPVTGAPDNGNYDVDRTLSDIGTSDSMDSDFFDPLSPALLNDGSSKEGDVSSAALVEACQYAVAVARKEAHVIAKFQRSRAMTEQMIAEVSTGHHKETDEEIKERLKVNRLKGIKRKRVVSPMIQELEKELYERQREHWLLKRGKKISGITVDEKNQIKNLFHVIDYDKSGEISIDELEDVLVSAGIAQSKTEVEALMGMNDYNNTGDIDFAEFKRIFEPPRLPSTNEVYGGMKPQALKKVLSERDRQERAHSTLSKLGAMTRDHGGLGIESVISIRRRELLLDTMIGGDPEGDRAVQLAAEREEYELRTKRLKDKAAIEEVVAKRAAIDKVLKDRQNHLNTLSSMMHRKYNVEGGNSDSNNIPSTMLPGLHRKDTLPKISKSTSTPSLRRGATLPSLSSLSAFSASGDEMSLIKSKSLSNIRFDMTVGPIVPKYSFVKVPFKNLMKAATYT